MINIKRLTENMQKMHPKQDVILEYTFSELKQASDSKRQSRAKLGGMITKYSKGKLDQSKDGHVRTHWVTTSQHGDGNYNQIVQINVPQSGGLFSMVSSKHKLQEIHNALKTADVRVHCSCPDFYWSGMKYNLGPRGNKKGALSPDANSGIPGEQTQPDAPNKRDPERKHVMCKHLLNVFDVFPFNAASIVKDIKDFAKNNPNMIMTNDETTDTLDNGENELNKDINRMQPDEGDKEGTVAVTEGEVLKGPLNSLANEIANSSEEGASDIIDDQNETIIDQENEPEDVIDINQSEEEEPVVDDEGATELIDDKNEEVIEPTSEIKVEPQEIIGESPTEENIDVSDVLNRSDETEDEDEEYTPNDVLSR